MTRRPYRSRMAPLVGIAKGGVLAGVVSTGCLAVGLVVGLIDRGSLVVFGLAAIGGAVYGWLPEPRGRGSVVLGSALVGLAALLLAVTTGLGALETAGLAGSLISVGLVLAGDSWRPAYRPSARLVGWAGVAIAVIALIPLVVGGETLGHDESAYALKGRAWLEGTPETGWSPHRGPVLSAYAYGALALGGDEAALRSIGVLAVFALAVATWMLGRKVGSQWVGPLAAVGVVAGPAILRRGTEFLTDIPTAALLVFCMVIAWREFVEKRTPSYALLWVLPLAWLAFYLRYQAILSFGLIALSILLLFWDRVRARPGPLVVGAVLGTVGLVPHFLFSASETGSPIGVLQFTGEVAGREYLGEGLVDYALLMGWPLAGFVGPVATVLFVWWIVRDWKSPDARRRFLYLLIPAAGQVIALGILSHGESRFVFFPLALAIVGGTTGLFELSQGWRPRLRRAALLSLPILLVGSLALSIAEVRRSVDNRILANEPVELASELVDDIDAQDTCAVMTSYLPQVTFYSLCWTDRFRTSLEAEAAVERLQGDPRFMILIEDGKRQPSGADLDELVSLTRGGPLEVEGERDDAVVYEFDS